MRTKHLLYTMALAGIFAACTQEEFETVNGADALAGRKSIGKVTFTEAPSTRWDVDNFNTIMPEAGDGYSLLLVDVPRQGLDGQHVYPIDNYELVNDVQTNYVFKTNDGVNFSNDAELVEGNYLFVAPAQEGKLDRKTVEITLPTEQNLSLGSDGKLDPLSAIKEFAKSGYPFYIGHRFLSEGGTVSNPAMRNIFAFPEITVTNTVRNAEHAPILKQVILKRTNGKSFVINATLDTKKAAESLTNEWFAAQEPDTKDQMVVGDWAAHMSKYFGESNRTEQDSKPDGTKVEIPSTVDYEVTYLDEDMDSKYYMYNNGLYGATSDLTSTPKSTSDYIVINMPGDGIELGYEDKVTFNAIIPADNYVLGGRNSNQADLEVYAVFGNDEAWVKVMSSNTNVTMYPGKRYPEQDYTGLVTKTTVGKYFTLDINPNTTDGQAKCEPVSAAEILGGVTTVKTTADLIAAIVGNSSTEKLNVTVEGRNVVYNDEVNKAVARTTCQDVNIQGYIKIEGSADSKNPLVIDPRVTMEQVVIENGYVEAEDDNLENVFVAKEGALNLTKAKTPTTGSSSAVINNAGTLTLNTTNFAKVDNYSVLKVGTDVSNVTTIKNLYAACGEGGEIISPSIDLKPSVEVLAGGTYAISGELDYPITVDAWTKANKSDAGVLKLSANTSIVKVIEKFGNKEVERIGNIINNGVMSGTGVLTVNAGQTMTVGQDATVTNKVVISPATKKLEDMIDGVEDYEPKAVVYNAGTLSGQVDVNGLLVMKTANARVDGEIKFTAAGNDEGEIDNTAKGVIAKTVPTDVVVFATIKEINLDDHENTVTALKEYTTTTSQVSVFRLIGEMKRVKEMKDDKPVFFKKEHVGGAVTAIEFMPGSSITLGEVTVESDMDFVARGKEIAVNGRTGDTSILKAKTENGYSYLGQEDGKDYSVEGSFKQNNAKIEL
ncbi:MAG: hypothetical protein H9791_03170 [Candidatus Bacteroides intestinipullorum]|uniref:Uncharacterized protein n=1 Tax=Candidatus Bacteroides intestinipullorum TaxID=2838471 RepID=A0A9E2NPT0_9BACE|nr:hypothetical protein [Candidatus Bacteroides intestinipullorum]